MSPIFFFYLLNLLVATSVNVAKEGIKKISLERFGTPSLHSTWRGSANRFPDEQPR